MVQICRKCIYYKKEKYCERLGIHTGHNSPICEFYIKQRSKNGSNSQIKG